MILVTREEIAARLLSQCSLGSQLDRVAEIALEFVALQEARRPRVVILPEEERWPLPATEIQRQAVALCAAAEEEARSKPQKEIAKRLGAEIAALPLTEEVRDGAA